MDSDSDSSSSSSANAGAGTGTGTGTGTGLGYNQTRTENGDLTYSSSTDSLTDLYYRLVRNCPRDRINSLLDAYLADESSLDETELKRKVVELACFLFHLRDVRGGKGERQLFYHLLSIIAEKGTPDSSSPSTICYRICELVTQFPNFLAHYGYYKDYLNLINQLESEYSSQSQSQSQSSIDSYLLEFGYSGPKHPLAQILLRHYCKCLDRDVRKSESTDSNSKQGLSLAWKYAPNEHSKKFGWIVKAICRKNMRRLRTYRRNKSRINHYISTVESKMATRNFKEIDYSRVPSKAMKNYNKAFCNAKGSSLSDRILGAEKFRQYLSDLSQGKTTINAKTLYPHELVREYIRGSTDNPVYEAQWQTLMESYLESLPTTSQNCLPLVDVSGSMSGQPMEVAIALGIVMARLNSSDKFSRKFVTFETNPALISLPESTSLMENVHVCKRAPWGGSTNIDKAIRLILDIAVDAELRNYDLPSKLIIFSDMQFDQADRNFPSRYEQLVTDFAEAGRRICGEPYNVPQIVYWNLRGDTSTVPEQNIKGVLLVSGFSVHIMNKVLNSDTDSLTPSQMVREIIYADQYQPVRDALNLIQQHKDVRQKDKELMSL